MTRPLLHTRCDDCRRKADSVGFWFARHRDPHPSATEHAEAVHAQSTCLLYASSARHPRWLHTVRIGIVDFTGSWSPALFLFILFFCLCVYSLWALLFFFIAVVDGAPYRRRFYDCLQYSTRRDPSIENDLTQIVSFSIDANRLYRMALMNSAIFCTPLPIQTSSGSIELTNPASRWISIAPMKVNGRLTRSIRSRPSKRPR